MDYIQSPSPNFFSRDGYKPELIVIHCTDGFYPTDLYYLQNPNPIGGNGPVSAHYLTSPTGLVHQLVQENMGAWHAGRVDSPTAKLKKTIIGTYVNPNKYTIGIENSLRATSTVPDAQYQALKKLIIDIATRNNIPIDRDHIVGHHEIYSQKMCPSPINVDRLVSDLTTNKERLKQEIRERLEQL